MFYQPPRAQVVQGYMLEDDMWPDDRATYISDEIVFKIIVICQMLCYLVQKQGTSFFSCFLFSIDSSVLPVVLVKS